MFFLCNYNKFVYYNQSIVESFFSLLYNVIGDIMTEVEKRIVEVINKIRPFLISDGGDIEFIKFEEGIVYVRLLGHCSNCSIKLVYFNQ